MSIVPVTDVGKYGIVKDIEPHRLPPEAWEDGKNWRFKHNGARRMKGEEAIMGTPSVDPFFLMPWQDISTYYWLYASGAAIYRTDGTSHLDISDAGGYNGGSEPNWTGGILGGVPVLNNTTGWEDAATKDYPQSWDGTSSVMEPLPNWPTDTYCRTMRVFKQYLLALGIIDDSGASPAYYSTRMMWSVEADPGTVPTSWTPAATNNAGDYSFSETTGALVDGAELGDMFVVYKEDSTYLARVVGGTFVIHTTEAFRTIGILAQGCMVEFERKHFVVTNGDVIVHDGAEVNSIIEGLDREYLFQTIDSSYRHLTRVEYHQQESEIWICYPVSGSSGLLTEAAIWNKDSSVWTFRELDSISCIAAGTVTDTVGTTYIISALTMTIDEMIWEIGAQAEQSGARKSLMMGKSGGSKALLVAEQTDSFNGSSYNAYLIRTGLAISGQDRRQRLIVDPTTIKYCSEFYPRVTAPSGTFLLFRFGSQLHFDDPVVWSDLKTFTVGTDRKIDLDFSFCFMGIMVWAVDDAYVQFDGYDLNLELVGRY